MLIMLLVYSWLQKDDSADESRQVAGQANAN